MNIIINEILISTLERLALENDLTAEQYASNIVSSFLESQYKASIIDKIKLEPIENLRVLKEENIVDMIKDKKIIKK